MISKLRSLFVAALLAGSSTFFAHGEISCGTQGGLVNLGSSWAAVGVTKPQALSQAKQLAIQATSLALNMLGHTCEESTCEGGTSCAAAIDETTITYTPTYKAVPAGWQCILKVSGTVRVECKPCPEDSPEQD